MTYDEALGYIHGISWTFCKPGLDRIRELCRLLGDPQDGLRFIHVAGTNGKGSTSAMLDSILRKAGYKVGLFTSPYIYRFNERMRVDGKNIPDSTLAEITEAVKPIADGMTDKPTEFELITAVALEYFKRESCDVVVLEAGMGGRLDSTNVIRDPLISIITGIALDHTAFLGDTVEKIAAEKAGIIKDGAPVLFGGDDAGAKRVITENATRVGSSYYESDRSAINIEAADIDGSTFSYKSWEHLRISLAGLYQPYNAALVLEAVDLLRGRGLVIPDGAVTEGLAETRWRGRFEVMCREPLVIFDGAHNPEGVSVSVDSIKRYFRDRRVIVLTGVMSDKDHGYIASRISEVACRAYTVTPDNKRALSAEEYAKELCSLGVAARPTSSIPEALRLAMADAKETGTPLVCLGSLYTYVDIMKFLEGEK